MAAFPEKIPSTEEDGAKVSMEGLSTGLRIFVPTADPREVKIGGRTQTERASDGSAETMPRRFLHDIGRFITDPMTQGDSHFMVPILMFLCGGDFERDRRVFGQS